MMIAAPWGGRRKAAESKLGAESSEETVVTDAMEAAGQHMNEEAADELVDGERHDLVALASFGAVILRILLPGGFYVQGKNTKI
jgi:hypothetical protein